VEAIHTGSAIDAVLLRELLQVQDCLHEAIMALLLLEVRQLQRSLPAAMKNPTPPH
jgi:hypothetical protein